eukprot:UN01554
MGLENTIIPLRFFASMGHLICLILIFSHTEDLTKNTTEKTSLLAAVWMSIGLMSVEFVGLFLGFTIFHHTSNLIYITVHGIGMLLTALFIGLSWIYWIFWFIFLTCSLISGIMETVNIIKLISCPT